MSRRGQAVVEVLALAPVITVLLVGFAVVADRIADHARSDRLAEGLRLARASDEPSPIGLAPRRGQATVVVVAVALPASVLALQALAVLAMRAAG